MPRLAVVLAVVAVLLGSLAPASAGIVVTVDQSEQRLSVMVDGVQRYQWAGVDRAHRLPPAQRHLQDGMARAQAFLPPARLVADALFDLF
jgi:hypothetical protein